LLASAGCDSQRRRLRQGLAGFGRGLQAATGFDRPRQAATGCLKCRKSVEGCSSRWQAATGFARCGRPQPVVGSGQRRQIPTGFGRPGQAAAGCGVVHSLWQTLHVASGCRQRRQSGTGGDEFRQASASCSRQRQAAASFSLRDSLERGGGWIWRGFLVAGASGSCLKAADSSSHAMERLQSASALSARWRWVWAS
jgi:hypothetical protein